MHAIAVSEAVTLTTDHEDLAINSTRGKNHVVHSREHASKHRLKLAQSHWLPKLELELEGGEGWVPKPVLTALVLELVHDLETLGLVILSSPEVRQRVERGLRETGQVLPMPCSFGGSFQ